MSLRRKRVHAYNEQNGRCFYCQWPMWERAFEPQDDALIRLNAVRSKRRDPVANLQSFECTAEHVVRRTDGGRNAATNIVAACLDCNSSRNEMEPLAWQMRRIALNQFDQAGHEKGFDPIFYSTPELELTEQYRFKWRHNFFVELPRMEVEIEVVKLGDFNRRGARFQTASSLAVVYPLFGDDDDFARPDEIYRGRTEIPGTQIMLESADHETALKAVFGAKVVKRK